MATLPHGSYEAYLDPDVQRLRVPQQVWEGTPPAPGAGGLPVFEGVVASFDRRSGNGTIRTPDDDDEVFFNFTAVPGSGYRILDVGTSVRFERVETPVGPASGYVRPLGNGRTDAPASAS
jgi:cold shock CspA family protein